MNKHLEQLMRVVVENSVAGDFEHARLEWEVVDCVDLRRAAPCGARGGRARYETCVCGYEGLRYAYTIRNVVNNHVLYPVGDQCIEHFDVPQMSARTEALRKAVAVVGLVSSIAPDGPVPLRRGEPGWRKATMTPGNVRALHHLGWLEPMDAAEGAMSGDYALSLLVAATGSGTPDPVTLLMAHVLMERRVRPRISRFALSIFISARSGGRSWLVWA